ncbi:hypothetical protein IHE45_05G055200 [Dioscorea alata]|uniref:Uncharacterized protein n=7 Tax=Dioscorea alata TaxID=55571 RepID=A0ACB7W169_DIOAL|nr:hypothetical protein IHE45_05G055200 [Dioscorea alata]KAH7681389.1 hypothetical protein IHE45_05G055200 [Dioscorea alata]KAH7681390.1 hypothetical protein IHE45_05G055200 [Dioscorea alata]KAH7681391.1 hypothetical protein IHE45_05G055200 [Dioscorea alata]KAH7681392.1 hypothetical protein IHE45_05G055200 [Dioscorea alata]
MATDVDQAFYGWSHDELPDSDRVDSQEVSVSQMLDHGSISFGRFAVESLAWAKRSVFTYNERQEELEKVKNPGLVAQKKAYFEEYYKKLRALKAMQDNQQTELTLEYGGDGSISSQTGEDEETMGQSEHYGNAAANIHDVLAKGTMIAPLEKDHLSRKASQTGHLDPESTLPCHDLFARDLKAAGQAMHSSNNIQWQHMDTDSYVGESLCGGTEVIVQHDIIELEVEKKYQDSVSGIQSNGAAQGPVVSIVEPVKGVQNTAASPTNYIQGAIEDASADNHAPKKNKSIVRASANSIYSSTVKELTVSARNGLKLENRIKPEKGNALQRQKHPIHKTTGKVERNIGSCTSTSSRVSKNIKSTVAVTHRTLTEVRSNGTIPRPFSLATERRAATFENKLDERGLVTKLPNRLTTSLNHAKGVISAQGSFNKTATTSGVRSKGQENKRGQEVQDKTLACGKQSFNGRSTLVLGQQKARSVDLPARNIPNRSGGIEHKFSIAFGRNLQKEIKEDLRSREPSGSGTRIMSSQNGNPRTGNIKAGQCLTKPDKKKLPIGNASVDVKKPKQPMPRWR